ncbi:unnamed protein product [Mytilus edulis]|uniref:Fibrinogen C-terminal domain-containing protein n=1 Tax=Mytilus edulis TaxID=6550 RepID=A0A8S3TQY5_MYTED|nr:unnamed protein product [Mytilus edulis]
MISKHAQETNLNATRKQQLAGRNDTNWTETDFAEMSAYLGILILIGIIQVPDYKLLWSTNKFLANGGVKEVMPVKRYEKLTQYLHVNEPEADSTDKLARIRPLLDSVLERCRVAKKRLLFLIIHVMMMFALIFSYELTHTGPHVRDCSDLDRKHYKSGVYKIFPAGGAGFKAYCDMETDGGGWTVFQRRQDGKYFSTEGWEDYVNGFGHFNTEFWMDREDQRRYLVVGSVILEVVTPLFQQRIEHDFTTGGFGSLQAFINSQHVIHTLFHLRHRNSWCCKDKTKCRNPAALPLVYCQWNKLYSENPGPGIHNCHCKFSANPVQLNELDISLSSLILLNCCTLSQPEVEAVQLLRQYKNDYLSHNTTGCITQTEYNTLWPDLVTNVLRLDPTKQDDLVRVEHRPLDESLCKKYFTFLLDLQQQLEEIMSTMQSVHSSIQVVSSSIGELNSSVQTAFHRTDTAVQGMDTRVQEMGNSIQGIETSAQQTNDLLKKGLTCECGRQIIVPLYNDQPRKQRKQYQLGQNIFYIHQELDLQSLLNADKKMFSISDVKMMDDGRLVFCLPGENRLLICNTDGSQADIITVQGTPWSITAVNISIVAVTVLKVTEEDTNHRLDMIDINKRYQINSISVPGMLHFSGVAMINNNLVVGGLDKLLIVDYQTGEVVQTIETYSIPAWIHASGDRVFFNGRRVFEIKNNIQLKMYSSSNNRVYSNTLQSCPTSITSLQDGSLYVLCLDGLIHHVSNDLKHTKKVKLNNIEVLNSNSIVSYNTTQNKMIVLSKNILSICHELESDHMPIIVRHKLLL